MPRTPTSIYCVPSADASFAAHARRVFEATRDGLEPAEAIRVFEARLRIAYPAAVVRAKEPLASLGSPETLWYVLRDGHDHLPSTSPVALVADDEPLIGELLGRLLSSHGWRVIVAPDAKTALIESGGLRIDLLVTDYEMPDISGIELAAQLREGNPSVRVVVVSGRPDLGELVEDPTIRIVTKPFDVSALLESVTGLVDLPSAATGEGGVPA